MVQWGRGPIPRIEFLRSTQAVNDRLGALWDEGAKEAVGRYLSYNDIMLTHAKVL